MYKTSSRRFNPNKCQSDLERKQNQEYENSFKPFTMGEAFASAESSGAGAGSEAHRKWVHKGSAWSKHGKHRHVNTIAIEQNKTEKPKMPFEKIDLKNLERK